MSRPGGRIDDRPDADRVDGAPEVVVVITDIPL
jgi:hypothetical protein